MHRVPWLALLIIAGIPSTRLDATLQCQRIRLHELVWRHQNFQLTVTCVCFRPQLCPGGDLKKALRADPTGRYLWYTRWAPSLLKHMLKYGPTISTPECLLGH